MLKIGLDAVAASGTDVVVLQHACHGVGPVRVYITNSGSNALTACKVQLGADAEHLVSIDVTTFESLAAGASAQLLIQPPVDLLAVLATCADGTALDIALTVEP